MTRTVTARLQLDIAQYVAKAERAGTVTKDISGAARQLQRDLAGLEAQQAKAARSIEQVARAEKAAQDKRNQSMREVGQTALIASGAMLVGFGAMVAVTATFDRQISAVGAASNATASELANLRDAALDAGASTAFSATEAAAAEEELAKAGISTADILGGALKGSLDLAAAGGLAVAKSAEIAADAMVIFGLRGRDVGHIADVLSAGAGKAQGTVEDMGMALSQAGLVAAQTGLSLDETVGTLAEFAAAGLKGSDAGTALKTMLLALNPQSQEAADLMRQLGIEFFDARGEFVGVAGVAGELKDALGGLSTEQQNMALKTIFGTDAIRSAAILMRDGAAGSREWTQAVNDQGFAAEQAAARMDNLAGDLEKLKGSLETALIQSGSSATGVLREMTQFLDGAISGFSDLPAPVQSTAVALLAVTTVGLGTVGVVGTLIPKFRELQESLSGMGRGGQAASRVVGAFGKSIGYSIPILGAAVLALSIYGQKKAAARAKVEEFTNAIQADNLAIGTNTRALAAKRLEEEGALKVADKYGISLSQVTEAAIGNAAAQQYVKGAIDDAYLALLNSTPVNERATQEYKDQRDELFELGHTLDGTTGDIDAAMESAKRQGEAQKETAGTTDDLTQSTQTAAEAFKEEKTAVEQLKEQLDALAGKNISVDQAQIGFLNSLDSLTQGIKDAKEAGDKNARSLDVQTQAGRDNKQAFIDAAVQAQQYAQAVADQTGSVDKGKATLKQSIDALKGVAVQSGLSKTEVDKLAERYATLPQTVNTDINAKDHATSVIDSVRRRLDGINGKTVRTFVLSEQILVKPRGGAAAVAGFASGGQVVGAGGPRSDSIPAMLSDGEYVVTAEAVNAYGVEFFDRLNAMQAPRFGSGGYVRHTEMVRHHQVVTNQSTTNAPVNVYAPPGMPIDVLAHKVAARLSRAVA